MRRMMMITVRHRAILAVRPLMAVMMRLMARARRMLGGMPMPLIVVARCHAL